MKCLLFVTFTAASVAATARPRLRVANETYANENKDASPAFPPTCDTVEVIDQPSCSTICETEDYWGGLWTTWNNTDFCVCYAPPRSSIACEATQPFRRVTSGRVTVNGDLKHSKGRPVGTYFTFEPAEWEGVFHRAAKHAEVFLNVDQWREGKVIWTGDVIVWRAKAKESHLPYGRIKPWNKKNVPTTWQNGDQIAPHPQPSNVVTIEADLLHTSKRPVGTYFKLDPKEWKLAFGTEPGQDKKFKNVDQWRDGEVIWTGNVRVWSDHDQSWDLPHGRIDPWKTNPPTEWHTGDQIAPRNPRLLGTAEGAVSASVAAALA